MSEDQKRMVVYLPASLHAKITEAARRDYSSPSDIARRALATDLRNRGLLADDDGVVVA